MLVADLDLLELCQPAQPEFKYGLGLDIGQVEALHQDGLGLILGADDPDDLVDIGKGYEQAFQDMDLPDDLVVAVLEPHLHRLQPVVEPFLQQGLEVEYPRPAIEPDHVQVHPVAAFEVRGGEQVVHERVQVDAVGARFDDQAHRAFMVGLVTQVGDHRQLLGGHLRGDLFQHLGSGDLVGQGVDDDFPGFLLPGRPEFQAAVPDFVDLTDFVRGGDQFRFRGIVRPPDVPAEIRDRGLGVIEEVDTGVHHLGHAVRRNIRRHADGDAGAAVQQHVGQPRREQPGFIQGAVEIGYPLGCALVQFIEQELRVPGQAGFRVAHGGEGFRVVLAAPVALPVDQRIAVTEGLRHQHHGLVAGTVAVGVELAQHVAHRAGRLLELGARMQAEVGHGIDDAPLYRFEPVGNAGERPVENDIHGVVEVCILGETGNGKRFQFRHRGRGCGFSILGGSGLSRHLRVRSW